MKTMTKQTATLIGAVAIAAIVLLGFMFGIVPLRNAAAADVETKESYATSNRVLQARVTRLEKEEQHKGELEAQVTLLAQQIPSTADLASATRVIVAALGPNTKITSATPTIPPVPFVAQPQLDSTIVELSMPQGPKAQTPSPDGGAGEPALQGLNEVPLLITADASSVDAAFRFLDNLNNGPRLLAIRSTSVKSKSGTDVSVTVQAVAFLHPRNS
jgi:hypothetical protein